MNKSMVIVLIDSGIERTHTVFKNQLFQDRLDDYLNKYNKIESDISDQLGHGTAIAGILHKANPNIRIIPIKVFEETFETEVERIINALNFVLELPVCHVVLLSLGVSVISYEQIIRMQDMCRAITEKGITIVSAFDNLGSLSYPASFQNVIGVDGDPDISLVNEYYIVYADKLVDIIAKSGLQRVAWIGNSYKIALGTSFAAAHVVNEIIRQCDVTKFPSKLEILETLSQYARKKIQIPISYQHSNAKMGKIQNACIYPFNKEMHSLLRFHKLLDFNIIGVFDEKRRGLVGKQTDVLLKQKDALSISIEPIESMMKIAKQFDTIILGHCSSLNARMKQDRRLEILSFAKKEKKNIFSFDDISFLYPLIQDCYIQQDDSWYYWPEVEQCHIPHWRKGRLWSSFVPVMGVWGTGSKQGKFTLQLMLRKILQEMGYKVGQIGTEPTAKLFGMDACYHMGYNENLPIRSEAAVLLLNEIMHQIEMKNPDIILVGSQSMTIPHVLNNLQDTTLKQWEFLLATNPDAVILCVSPQDSIAYINRTISFIESAADTRVVATVLFPVRLKQGWVGYGFNEETLETEEYKVHIQIIREVTKRPCYEFEYGQIKRAVDRIIDEVF